MLDFEYKMPVNLIFGRGKTALAGEVCKRYGKKVLIVTGKNSTKKTGLLYRVTDYLEQAGLKYVVFDKVEQNPLTTTVAAGVAIAKAENCDVVLGLGGGSPMDAAKGIAFSFVNAGDISEYIFGKLGNGALPLVLITTTAGTGSEADSIAVLTNPLTKDKKALKSRYIYPQASIIDPELMTTIPPKIIAATGFDALCHAIEAYLSKKSHPISDVIALKTMAMIAENLPTVYQNPGDIAAWEQVALANTLGGMVLDTAGATLAHGMEHPLSGLLDIVHGQGLAALTVSIMEYTYLSATEKCKDIAVALGEDVSGLSVEEAAAKSVVAIQKLLQRIDLTVTLHELAVSERDLDWLANNALETMKHAISNHPKVPDLNEIKAIYKNCL